MRTRWYQPLPIFEILNRNAIRVVHPVSEICVEEKLMWLYKGRVRWPHSMPRNCERHV